MGEEKKNDHIEVYQLRKLAHLIDEFEEEMESNLVGNLVWEEDYSNILFQTAGKASMTIRAVVKLCWDGLPDAALALTRQIYEQSMILCFFENMRLQPEFEDYVEDYYKDYDIQREKYFKWYAEHVSHDSNELQEHIDKLDEIKKKIHREAKGDYCWTGKGSFTGLVAFLMSNPNEKIARHYAMAHLCYLRACKEVHGGSLGNRLRLGSNQEFCGVDNSIKVNRSRIATLFLC